ncbi:MAG TPA: hypothetical protein VNL71_00200 [Chloroflexota bacterium]|nr:hypothetical protein [Chloroflexota bacterium]
MTWLVWRHYRGQAAVAGIALAALAALLLASGIHLAAVYHAALAACQATHSCNDDDLSREVFAGNDVQVAFAVVNLTLAIPLLFGMFWGAPLVAREVEQATQKLVWMQTVTRTRWLTSTLGWIAGAAAILGGAVAALVTWWFLTVDAIQHNRFQPGWFDVQGLAPVAYTLFAVALGASAGALLRRTLPALFTTAGLFVGIRLLVATYVRPHYMGPVTGALPWQGISPLTRQSIWTFSARTFERAGRVTTNTRTLLAGCHHTHGRGGTVSCVAAEGYRRLITYQPENRFWAFQVIELALYLTLATGLIAFTLFWIRRCDA